MNNKPTVAVLIPRHNEPLEAVMTTISACISLDRSACDVVVYVLDDGPSESKLAKELAASIGYLYIRSHNGGNAKPGNMNFGLRLIPDSDYVAVVDVGDAPFPEFLTSAVTLLEADRKLGYVQGKTETGVDAINAVRGLLSDAHETALLANTLASVFGESFVLCTGSVFVVRRCALVAIGGFPENSVADDYLMSMHLTAAGWLSASTSETVGHVPYPEGLFNAIRRELRCILGSLQVWLQKPNPFQLTNIPLRARLKLGLMPLTHLLEILSPFFLILPLVALAIGPSSAWPAWLFLLGSAALSVGGRLLCGVARRQSFWWSTLYTSIASWLLLRGLMKFVLNPAATTFVVTEKGKRKSLSRQVIKYLYRPLTAVLIAYVLATIWFLHKPLMVVHHWAYAIAALSWTFYMGGGIVHGLHICWKSIFTRAGKQRLIA
jgi:cellulose synthase (UDP-forming)